MENFGDAAAISGSASPEHLHSTKKSSQQARAPRSLCDKKLKLRLHFIRDSGRFNLLEIDFLINRFFAQIEIDLIRDPA
jgi:hypothetical protein